jgi:hypothetical protein
MDNFKEETGLRYGSPIPGVLEIKFHNPKRKNAISK